MLKSLNIYDILNVSFLFIEIKKIPTVKVWRPNSEDKTKINKTTSLIIEYDLFFVK